MTNLAPINKKGILLPNQLLSDYGCRNCVWKSFGQCPNKLEGDQSLPEGYCLELVDFLVSLAGKDGSISSIKEKFMIYVQEIQALTDFKDYNNLKREYDKLIKAGEYGEKARQVEMRMNACKMWWSKLNEGIIKGLGKISDRESRIKDNDITINHKINLNQIHQLINNAKKVEYNDS